MTYDVLMVDDNPDDRLLAKRAILKELPDTRFIEPRNDAELTDALSRRYDAVITDYRLGWSTGLDVLAKVRAAQADVPVVMFTNTGSEEIAAEGMRRGLSDYLIKGRDAYAKLPQSLRVAIGYARQSRQLEQQRLRLQETESRLRTLLERERSAREEADKARAQAQQANAAKDEFLATLSHELRTPLTAMLGWAHLLQRTHDDPAMLQRGLDAITRNARAQAKLIGDLLDLSRIASGKLRLDIESFDVIEAVREAAESARPLAADAGLQLDVVLDPQAARVNADPARVHQIVANLLSNAIRFTPRGGHVQVTAAHVGSYAEITVSDSGIGIDPGFLPHVFDGFRLADTSTRREQRGLGIGLRLVKNLSELHGGQVFARSAGLGRGAAFVVCLPIAVALADAAAASPGATRDASLAGVPVLVVDDDEDSRIVVAQMLRGAGAEVVTAAGADQGLALIRMQAPHVVVSDIGMPGKDGHQFIAELRALHDAQIAATPALALTAFARSEDRQRALLAGFDAHAAKPIEPDELVAVVAGLAAQRGRLLRAGRSLTDDGESSAA